MFSANLFRSAIVCAVLLLFGSSLETIAQTVTGNPPPVPARAPSSNSYPGMSVISPAPVPHSIPEQVAPSERISGAGPGGLGMSGPANGSPFSSSPTGNLPSDFKSGPHSREGVNANESSPPNLSR